MIRCRRPIQLIGHTLFWILALILLCHKAGTTFCIPRIRVKGINSQEHEMCLFVIKEGWKKRLEVIALGYFAILAWSFLCCFRLGLTFRETVPCILKTIMGPLGAFCEEAHKFGLQWFFVLLLYTIIHLTMNILYVYKSGRWYLLFSVIGMIIWWIIGTESAIGPE